MPGMTHLDINAALGRQFDLIELKVDGSRHTFDGVTLSSDRKINRNDRYAHIVEELKTLDVYVRGEVAIPNSNVLRLNKRESWPHAKFFIFDLYSFKGQDVTHLPVSARRKLTDLLLTEHSLNHITAPQQFSSVVEGWKFVKENDAEGLVLKLDNGFVWKSKYLKEEKLKIVGHETGKTKGSFIIERDGVLGKVSGTSDMFLRAYQALVEQDEQPYAEIEYSFLTEEGKPYQPRLRRLGTLDMLSTDS